MPYQKLGLKCGIEIHQQLEGKKLFCNCPTLLRDDEANFIIKRKLRASAGESGVVDVAVKQERIRNKQFLYQGYHDTTCLVEVDEEPPHEINKDSFFTTLQLAKLVKADVSPIVQVMRKTVIDGSNTSGFQRTALVARNGVLETSGGKVRIDNISLEEEACKIISENSDEKVYKLDRLGIPLIEIGTAPDIKTPKQCQETSRKLGMFLRSLPGVKRGLGTIRQDINISIEGGNRIEVKGFQDLKTIPKLIELEVKRQAELLKIKRELYRHRLNDLLIVDLSVVLKDCQSKVIQKTLNSEGKIMGIKLHGFAGLIGREIQPNNRIGTEFSNRAKVKAGVGGVFHSDELPNYGITEKEIKIIRKKLHCEAKDAFVLVADDERKARLAMGAVYERAAELFTLVPKEVRRAKPDGTTEYMRPIPGAARMYPETDVPLIVPDNSRVELPELLEEKSKRFKEQYKLSEDLAEFVAKSDKFILFEELVNAHDKVKPAFIADVLVSIPLEIKRKYNLDSTLLIDDNFRDVLKYLSEEKIHKDIVLDVMIDMINGKFKIDKYASLSTEELHAVVKEVVKANKGAPMGALMGMCMKKLAGKASGKIISESLRKILG